VSRQFSNDTLGAPWLTYDRVVGIACGYCGWVTATRTDAPPESPLSGCIRADFTVYLKVSVCAHCIRPLTVRRRSANQRYQMIRLIG